MNKLSSVQDVDRCCEWDCPYDLPEDHMISDHPRVSSPSVSEAAPERVWIQLFTKGKYKGQLAGDYYTRMIENGIEYARVHQPPQMTDETFLKKAREEDSQPIAAGCPEETHCPACGSTDLGILSEDARRKYCRDCTTTWNPSVLLLGIGSSQERLRAAVRQPDVQAADRELREAAQATLDVFEGRVFLEDSAPIVERLQAALAASPVQPWCDHCSADLNDVRHILCEKCYRRFDSDEHTRAVAGLSDKEKELYPRHPNDPAVQPEVSKEQDNAESK